MSGDRIPIDEVLTILETTPGKLAEITAELSPSQLKTEPGPGEWSPNDILAHLRSCSDMWGQCIATILAEDHPTIKAVNPTTFVKRTNYPTLEFKPSLEAFTEQRVALLVELKELLEEDWARTATVVGAGRPLERTTEFYAQWLARHERSHFRPLARTVKAVLAKDKIGGKESTLGA